MERSKGSYEKSSIGTWNIRGLTDKSIELENKKQKEIMETLNVGIWNVKGIKGKEEELIEEMEKMKINVLGITETKKKGTGTQTLSKGYRIWWSGIRDNKKAQAGVAIITDKKMTERVIDINNINERILIAKMKVGNEIMNMIVTYGPNENAVAEEKNIFFEEVQREVDLTENNDVIIMGDLNGRVGKENEGLETWLGREGEGTINNNGKRIIQLCIENDLIITNTKFKHKDIHKYTREEPGRGEISIIDYFLVNAQLWKDVKVQRGGEIGSDHYLVRMKLRQKHQETGERKRKIIKEQIRSYKLREEKVRRKYHKALETRINTDHNELSVEERWAQLKMQIRNAARESCGVAKVGNTGTKRTAWWNEEIQRQVKEKKQKWRRYLTTKSMEDYNKYKEERKKVKEIVKKNKQEAWEQFGEKLARTHSDNQKLFYGMLKNMRKPKENMLKNIKNKTGKILIKEEEIMDRWREYFEEILQVEEKTGTMDMIELSENETHIHEVKSDEGREITEEELTEAIRKLKLGKAPGQDGITNEMIKYLNKKGKQQLSKLLNQVRKQRKTPEEWE